MKLFKIRKPIVVSIVVVVIGGLISIGWLGLRAPQTSAESQSFVVPLNASHLETLTDLKKDGLIRSDLFFSLVAAVRGVTSFEPGGYTVSASENAWQIASAFKHGPTMIWVTIPEGLRKEEIGSILAQKFNWTQTQRIEWNTIDTDPSADYEEGVYFPDTYLFAKNETPADAANRMRNTFQEQFAPYAEQALNQNIKWTTVLKVASLIQREAAGTQDASLISGIIWNRLSQDMDLDIDSTVQYARGNTGGGWWAPITPADEKINSPYNTYLHSGLPPTPIDNPGLSAIDAALNPATTSCLYYLHDASGMIHCATTYAEQEQNIETYLK